MRVVIQLFAMAAPFLLKWFYRRENAKLRRREIADEEGDDLDEEEY